MNDLLGAGALRALSRAQVRVPQDVLVSSWDDTVLSRFSTPALTTISPDTHAIAHEAVAGLIALIEGSGRAGDPRGAAEPVMDTDEAASPAQNNQPSTQVSDVTVSYTLTVRESTKRF